MKRFTEIVKHYEDSVKWYGYDKYKPHKVEYNDYYFTIRSDEYDIRGNMSLNELLSLESGFLQACKWTDRMIRVELEIHELLTEEYWDNQRQYHAMRLSILSQEDKIKYLEDNVIIE